MELHRLKIKLQQLKIQLQQQLYFTGASFQRAAAIKGPTGPRALGPGPRAQIQLQQLKIQLQQLKNHLQQLKIQLQQLKNQLQQQLYYTGASFQRAAAIKGPTGPRALGLWPRAQIQLQQLKI